VLRIEPLSADGSLTLICSTQLEERLKMLKELAVKMKETSLLSLSL